MVSTGGVRVFTQCPETVKSLNCVCAAVHHWLEAKEGRALTVEEKKLIVRYTALALVIEGYKNLSAPNGEGLFEELTGRGQFSVKVWVHLIPRVIRAVSDGKYDLTPLLVNDLNQLSAGEPAIAFVRAGMEEGRDGHVVVTHGTDGVKGVTRVKESDGSEGSVTARIWNNHWPSAERFILAENPAPAQKLGAIVVNPATPKLWNHYLALTARGEPVFQFHSPGILRLTPRTADQLLRQLADHHFRNGVTTQALESFMAEVRARIFRPETYGFGPLLSAENATFQQVRQPDGRIQILLVMPDGRQVLAVDCFDAAHKIAAVLRDYTTADGTPIDAQPIFGASANGLFDGDVVVQFNQFLKDGKPLRLSTVPTVEAMNPHLTKEQVVSPEMEQQQAARRETMINFSGSDPDKIQPQMRPVQMTEHDDTTIAYFLGVDRTPEEKLLYTLMAKPVRGGEVLAADVAWAQVVVPMRDLAGLQRVLHQKGPEQLLPLLHERQMIRTARGHVEQKEFLTLLQKALSVPVKEKVISAEQMELTMPPIAADHSSFAVTPLDQILGRAAASAPQTIFEQATGVVILSDSMLMAPEDSQRRSIAQLTRFLAAMPRSMAQRTVLVGEGWRPVSKQNRNVRFIESRGPRDLVEYLQQLQISKAVSIRLFGEFGNIRGLESAMREFGFQNGPVPVRADMRNIQNLLMELGLALGVPRDIIEEVTRELFREDRAILPVLA